MQAGWMTDGTVAHSNVRRTSSTAAPSVPVEAPTAANNQLALVGQGDMAEWEVDAWMNTEEPTLGAGSCVYDDAHLLPLLADSHWAESVAELLAAPVEPRPDSTSQENGTSGRGFTFPERHAPQPSSGPFVPYTYYPFVDLHVTPESSPELDSYMDAMHCFELPEPAILDEFI